MVYVAMAVSRPEYHTYLMGVYSTEEKATNKAKEKLDHPNTASTYVVAFDLDGQRREIISFEKGEEPYRYLWPIQ